MITPSPAAAPTSQEVDPLHAIDRVFGDAVRTVVPAAGEADPQVRASANAAFGDYQVNAAMALAKAAGRKPRDIAVELAQAARDGLATIAEPLDDKSIAGPGFINIRLKAEFIAVCLGRMDAPHLGVPRDAESTPVVIDLCGVNVAKQMHVGHLRATIIGDALANIIGRLGRPVIRQNHLGDWGLPIAMVLHHLRARKVDLSALKIEDLDAAYREAQAAAKEGAPHAAQHIEAAKGTLLKLQAGDADVLRDWRTLIDVTMRAVNEVLDLLGVVIPPEANRGESFFRDRLAGVVDAFVRAGAAKEDAGAIVVPFADRERPLLIRKSDGGYLYATTDLAAVRYRTFELGGTRVVYVVDARQRDHFKDVFDAARLAGWNRTPDGREAELLHVPFGSVLGQDKKPLKTRSGENVTLRSLLEEAIARGQAEVQRRAADAEAPTHGLPDHELRAIGKAVGIAAVKYADLSTDLVHDYIFNLDRMVAFEGATGPYLQYAHARIASIFAKVESAGVGDAWRRATFIIGHAAERALALHLLRYGGTVREAARTLAPHRLCTYLYDLANLFAAFYQECPVLKAPEAALRDSRLRLSSLVQRTLADGLRLLGIEAPMRM